MHFLLIGAALFTGHALLNPNSNSGENIVVTKAMIEDMQRQYQSLKGAPPGTEELAGLIDTHVREEIFYREGLALGLDRDDAVIKRRIRQKLEIMAEEQGVRDAPTDAELSAYMTRHAERFMQAARLSFEQVFFDTTKPGPELEQRIASTRTALVRGSNPATQGDATMLPRQLTDTSIDQIARDFGTDFAQALIKIPPSQWSEPLLSGYGAHLLRIGKITPAALPALAEIRPQVMREWEHEQRENALKDNYQKLRANYKIVIEAAPKTLPKTTPTISSNTATAGTPTTPSITPAGTPRS